MSKNRNRAGRFPVNHSPKLVAVREELLSGPLPHPDILQKFDLVVPGSAERIIVMAENQSNHRQKLETKVIESDIKRANMGLWFGLIIGLAGLGFGFTLLYLGKIVEGSVFAGMTLVSLVGSFIYGSQSRRRELIQKRQQQ